MFEIFKEHTKSKIYFGGCLFFWFQIILGNLNSAEPGCNNSPLLLFAMLILVIPLGILGYIYKIFTTKNQTSKEFKYFLILTIIQLPVLLFLVY